MSLRPKYTLYYSIRSPFARRIRVALQRLTLTFEAREIDVFRAPPDFYEANPLGYLPVLMIQDGGETVALPESSLILEYLDDTYGGKVWPTEPSARLRVRAASTLAKGVMENTVAWYLETTRATPSAECAAECVENIDRTLAMIARSPWKSMPWKISDFQVTQAGYDLVIALEYLSVRMKAYDWTSRYPELARFLELHRVRQDLAPTAPPQA